MKKRKKIRFWIPPFVPQYGKGGFFMATYHLRIKNDTKPTEKKYRQNVTLNTSCVKKEMPTPIISIGKVLRAVKMIVSSRAISYRNGRKARLKNFSRRQHAMRIKAIVDTKKLSCLCPTSWLWRKISQSLTSSSLIIWLTTIMPMRYTRKRESCQANGIRMFISCFPNG